MINIETFRAKTSRWLMHCSVGLLAYTAVALVIAWAVAAHQGRLQVTWGEAEGNHGPWRHFYPGRMLIQQALMAPLAASTLGLLSYFGRRPTRTLVLSVIAILAFFGVALTHFWLID